MVIPYTAFGSTKKITGNPQSDKLAIMHTLKKMALIFDSHIWLNTERNMVNNNV